MASFNFKRLPLYFDSELLAHTRVVLVDKCPVPPLSLLGLLEFKDFENGDFNGITYINTYFLVKSKASDEALHFHELVHVLQWHLLGVDGFLTRYANEVIDFKYENSPLEKMAVGLQARFTDEKPPFNVAELVSQELERGKT